jgi:hypothetical protein
MKIDNTREAHNKRIIDIILDNDIPSATKPNNKFHRTSAINVRMS